MMSYVILALALAASAYTLPFSTQDSTATDTQSGIHTEGTYVDTVKPITTQGEKSGFVGTTNLYTQGGNIIKPISEGLEKFEVQGSPEVHTVPKYQGVGTTSPVTTQERKTGVPETYTGTNEKYTGFQAVQSFSDNVGQPVFQKPVDTYTGQQYAGSQKTNAVPKTETEPLSTQVTYTESPILLPVQPLNVLPINQEFTSGQLLTPVIVPAETITAKGVIIMAIEPIGKRVLQHEASTNSEKAVLQQQTIQPSVSEYVPVQAQVVQSGQQQVYNVQPEGVYQTNNIKKQVPYQQTPHSAVSEYPSVQAQVVQPGQQQVYSVQPGVTHQVNNVEKQVPYQQSPVSEYVSVQAQVVQPGQQQVYNVQPEVTHQVNNVEKQVPYQQSPVSEYVPVQAQVVQPGQQQGYSVQPEVTHQVNNVEKQVPYQQTAQQPVSQYVPDQAQVVQPSHQQVLSVQPESTNYVDSVVKQVSSQQHITEPTVTGHSPDQTITTQTQTQQLTRNQGFVNTSPEKQTYDHNQVHVQLIQTNQQFVDKQATQTSTFSSTVPEHTFVPYHEEQIVDTQSSDKQVEKQASYQQSIQLPATDYSPVQTQVVEPNQPKPQVYIADNVEKQVPYQQTIQQPTEYSKGVEQQYSKIPSQEVNNVVKQPSEFVPSFGDKLPQYQKVDYEQTHTSSPVGNQQGPLQSVEPLSSVVVPEEKVVSQ